MREWLDEGEEAKKRIGSCSVFDSEGIPSGCSEGHGVAALEVGNAAGGNVADLVFVAEGPKFVGGAGYLSVEDDFYAAARFTRTLAKDDLSRNCALPPVNVVDVIPLAHRANSREIVAMPAANGGSPFVEVARGIWGEEDGVDRGVDDKRAGAAEFAGLFKEAERKAGGDAEADVLVPSAASGSASVGRDLGGASRDLEKEAALVGGLTCAQVLDFDGVGWEAALVVVDFDFHQMGLSDLSSARQAPSHREVTEAQFAQDARDDDERQEEPEEEVKEIVTSVDCCEADDERDGDEVLALARQLEATAPVKAHER